MSLSPPDAGRFGRLARVALLVVIALWVPVLTGLRFEAKRDEQVYHLPLVTELAQRAPTFDDFRNARVEMGPFFHVILGSGGRLFGTEPWSFRLQMLLAGLATVALFAALVRQSGAADWTWATLLLAAFPYFGVCYFTVMTDYAAFLFLVGSWLAQVRYLQTGGRRALWVGALAATAACAVRQSAIFAPAAFGGFVVAERIRHAREAVRAMQAAGGTDAEPRGPTAARWSLGELFALVLPLLPVLLRLALWGHLIPPEMRREEGFLGLDADVDIPGGPVSHYALAMTSMMANVGYYLIPATLAVAVAARRSARRWGAVLAIAVALALGLSLLRGPQLITTNGTFLHGVTFLRLRFGDAAALAVVVLSLASFLTLVDAARLALRERSGDPAVIRFLLVLLAAGLLVLGFGKFRIFERYVVPLHALAIVVLATVTPRRGARWVRAGFLIAVGFGLAHEILYASDVYDLGLLSALSGRAP